MWVIIISPKWSNGSCLVCNRAWFNPSLVIPTTLKVIHTTSLLGTQHGADEEIKLLEV